MKDRRDSSTPSGGWHEQYFRGMEYRVTFACRLDVEADDSQQAVEKVRELVPDFLHPLSYFKPMVLPVSKVMGVRSRREPARLAMMSSIN
jgi:hypothetical protein